MTVTNTLFLFSLSLTPFFPYKYSLCLGASIFLIPSLIPCLNHNPSHSLPYLVPVSLISPCPKPSSHFMTFDLFLFPVPKCIFLWFFFPFLDGIPFLHSSQAASYSMLSSDLREEGREHLTDTFILFVFSTTGNWKKKSESKSWSDLQAPGKNTYTADRIFEEAGKWNMQTILRRIRFLQTEEDLHRPVQEEYPFPSSGSHYKPVQ